MAAGSGRVLAGGARVRRRQCGRRRSVGLLTHGSSAENYDSVIVTLFGHLGASGPSWPLLAAERARLERFRFRLFASLRLGSVL